MPYIPQEWRELDWNDNPALTPGQLNYVVTVACDDYLADRGLSYSTINEVIGVLECAKQELYRRIAVPYEDRKRYENGDVYTVNEGK